MKFKIITLFVFLISVSGMAQEAFEMDVFVDSNKTIYLENKEVTFGELLEDTKTLIYNQPAIKYNRLVFNIYADKNLKHGFIMDVNQKLIRSVEGMKSKTNKFLLEYKNINLDDSGWQEEVKSLELNALKD